MRGSVRCPHDRQPKGQCRVGARQSCGATSLSASGGDATRPLIAFQDLAQPTCVGWSGPASGPKPRKRRSGTGRPLPTALSDTSLTRLQVLTARSPSAGATAPASVSTSKLCFTRCPRRARGSCALSYEPSIEGSWQGPRSFRLTAWTCHGGEARSRTMGGGMAARSRRRAEETKRRRDGPDLLGWSLSTHPQAGRHPRPRARGVRTDAEQGFRFRGRTAVSGAVRDDRPGLGPDSSRSPRTSGPPPRIRARKTTPAPIPPPHPHPRQGETACENGPSRRFGE